MDTEQLIAQFKLKDLGSFEKLYEMYSENICSVVLSIVRNPKLAQEITNDVFVKVWNNSETYAPAKGRFFTWIVKIARNTAIDVVRSKSYKKDQMTRSLDCSDSNPQGQKEVADTTDAPEIDIRLHLKNFKYMQIIDLLYFQGYTQQEAAEELAIPLGTVKSRNRNCLNMLRGLKGVREWIY